MNLIDRIKLSFYPELKNLNISDKQLQQIISNKNFKRQYKTSIKPFIKHLHEYKYNNGTSKQVGLDDEIIKNHLKAVFELSIQNNSDKYISFVTKYSYENNKLPNFEIINDPNFEKLYSLIGYNVFNENTCKIINDGNSNRLIEFINNNGYSNLTTINPAMFHDKVWNIISKNPLVGDVQVLKLFEFKMDILIDIINNDFYEGMKYTYENIPESHNYFKLLGTIKKEEMAFQQLSMDFIKNIGDKTLNGLYARHEFSKKEEFDKIFEISSLGNYELIQDIVNYDTYEFSFNEIEPEDMTKPLLETKINYYDKQEVFLNKYFGIEKQDVRYIKLFLESINKLKKFPDGFTEKYESILTLLNQILCSTDEEIIEISKTMDKSKKELYKELIYSCEREGNEILKEDFVEDLQKRNQKIIETAEHREITTHDGKTIDVYELSGQPFTMLVHAITDNNASNNNSYVRQIINNPDEWDKIDQGNNHISASLISDKFMATYGAAPNNDSALMFGFSELPSSTLKLTNIADSGINRDAPTTMDYNMRNWFSFPDNNTVTTIDELMEKTIRKNQGKTGPKMWNEVVLSRVEESSGRKIEPNFIVCMDNISESSKQAAQQFNIPIYLINRKCYREGPYSNEQKKELDTMLSELEPIAQSVSQKQH